MVRLLMTINDGDDDDNDDDDDDDDDDSIEDDDDFDSVFRVNWEKLVVKKSKQT